MRRSVELSALSHLECLILSQAVFELGAGSSSWQTVVKIITKHPLLERERRPKSFFTPAVCSTLYDLMLKEAGMERTEENDAIHAKVNQKLSEKYFKLRYDEVFRLIQEEEVKFKTIASEIEDIRAGKWVESDPTGEERPESASEEPSIEAIEEELVEDPPASPAEARREEEEEHTEEEQEEQAQAPAEEEDPDRDVEMEAAEEVPEDKDDEQDAAEEATREESEAKEEEKASSGEDEPPQTIRRSTRRKSSASTAPPLPKRNRRQQRDVTPQPAAEAEDAGDTPRTDENPSSSPFETPTRTREGKRKASTLDTLDSGGRDSKRQRDDSEFPEDDDQLESPAAHNTRSRPTRGGGRSEEHLAIKRFQSVIGFVYSQISQHRNGTIFHNPIKPSEAPDYHEVVKKPIDLKTIKARIKDGLISNSLEFQRDIYLMFANAMMYNRPGSDVYTMAGDMMIDAETWIHDFRQTEGYIRAGHR